MSEMSKEQLLDTLLETSEAILLETSEAIRIFDAFRDGVIKILDNDSKDAEERLDDIRFLVEESGVALFLVEESGVALEENEF